MTIWRWRWLCNDDGNHDDDDNDYDHNISTGISKGDIPRQTFLLSSRFVCPCIILYQWLCVAGESYTLA